MLWLVSCPSALWLANCLDFVSVLPRPLPKQQVPSAVNIAISVWAGFRPREYWTRESRRTFARTDIARHIRVVTLLVFFVAKSQFVAAYMQIHSLPAGVGSCWSGRDWASPVMAVNKAVLSSQILLYQTLHARWNENDIQIFPKIVGFLQKYSDIKTPAPGFDFEMCSAHVYSTKSNPFGKSICGSQFWYCGGRHK